MKSPRDLASSVEHTVSTKRPESEEKIWMITKDMPN